MTHFLPNAKTIYAFLTGVPHHINACPFCNAFTKTLYLKTHPRKFLTFPPTFFTSRRNVSCPNMLCSSLSS